MNMLNDRKKTICSNLFMLILISLPFCNYMISKSNQINNHLFFFLFILSEILFLFSIIVIIRKLMINIMLYSLHDINKSKLNEYVYYKKENKVYYLWLLFLLPILAVMIVNELNSVGLILKIFIIFISSITLLNLSNILIQNRFFYINNEYIIYYLGSFKKAIGYIVEDNNIIIILNDNSKILLGFGKVMVKKDYLIEEFNINNLAVIE